jgi:hypothetical protein
VSAVFALLAPSVPAHGWCEWTCRAGRRTTATRRCPARARPPPPSPVAARSAAAAPARPQHALSPQTPTADTCALVTHTGSPAARHISNNGEKGAVGQDTFFRSAAGRARGLPCMCPAAPAAAAVCAATAAATQQPVSSSGVCQQPNRTLSPPPPPS